MIYPLFFVQAEHIMMKTDGNKTTVKIIDFGLATIHKPGDPPLTAFAGSAFTVAPEVIQRQYGKEVDLWSVGVITYFLLTHQMPFNAHSNDEMFKKIQSGVFYYPKWARDGISENAKDFIERLLVVNPTERMTARQALSHSWIRKFHRSASQTDLDLAVVLYNNEGENAKRAVTSNNGDARRQRQRDVIVPTQALVVYGGNETNDRHKSRDSKRRQHRCGKNNGRRPDHGRHKSSRPHPDDVLAEKGRRRPKKDADRKVHPHPRYDTATKHHITLEESLTRRRRH